MEDILLFSIFFVYLQKQLKVMGTKTKVMTTSEFAEYIFNKFPQAVRKSKYGTVFSVMKRGGYSLVYAWEPNSGKTKLSIGRKRYSQMSAAEKREAKEFIDNFEFDIVYDNDVTRNKTEVFNYETGAFFEGEKINVYGSDIPWRKIEKVIHVK